jgi:hypothetical protein
MDGPTEPRDAAREAKSSRGECLLVGRNANQATSRHYAHIFDAPPMSCQQTRRALQQHQQQHAPNQCARQHHKRDKHGHAGPLLNRERDALVFLPLEMHLAWIFAFPGPEFCFEFYIISPLVPSVMLRCQLQSALLPYFEKAS